MTPERLAEIESQIKAVEEGRYSDALGMVGAHQMMKELLEAHKKITNKSENIKQIQKI